MSYVTRLILPARNAHGLILGFYKNELIKPSSSIPNTPNSN